MAGENFTVYKDQTGQWRWRFVAANNRILADSAESYHNRMDAVHAIGIIKTAGATAPAYDITAQPPQIIG